MIPNPSPSIQGVKVLGFFDGSNGGKPDHSSDGSDDCITVISYVESLLRRFYGSNEDKPGSSFDASNDGITVVS